jgi:pyrroline-5-carboxylate reductase
MKLAFLGAGKMATAIATGIVKKGILPPQDLCACDISKDAQVAFTEKSGVACSDFAPEMFAQADAVLLAVKPQKAAEALASLPELKADCLVVSIMAGVTLARLAELLGTKKLIRTMPNTPLMVASGATGFARGPEATDADAAFVQRVFGALGFVGEVPEESLDAVTALSGSGPAYVFEMVQALVDAGTAVGLPPELALGLTVQTVAGAAEMLRQGMGTPDELRIAVTSPGGTTAAGLAVMADAGYRDIMRRVVAAARDRGVELGQGK